MTRATGLERRVRRLRAPRDVVWCYTGACSWGPPALFAIDAHCRLCGAGGWQIDQVDRRSAGKGRTGTNAVERQQRPETGAEANNIHTVYRGLVIFRAGKLQNRPLDRLGLGVDLGPRRLGTGFGDADARPSAWASSAPPEASPMAPQLDIHWRVRPFILK